MERTCATDAGRPSAQSSNGIQTPRTKRLGMAWEEMEGLTVCFASERGVLVWYQNSVRKERTGVNFSFGQILHGAPYIVQM
jgi:hypothetical protein